MNRLVFIAVWLAAVPTGGAAVFEEPFQVDPLARGWRSFGDTTLFRWNATHQNLEVTWDSSRTNSFFYQSLGTILTKADDFSVSFDLRLNDIRVGSTSGKTNEFEIAVGLLNYSSATNANAFRGAGVSSTYGVRNLVEFDYFPDAGFGDTVATTVVSTNNRIFPVHNFPLTLTPGAAFRITLAYTASNQVLHTSATRNGLPFGMPPNDALGDLPLAGRPDFRVDSFAVISYSDAIQVGDPQYYGSVLAHGTVDNVQIISPDPPVAGVQLRRSAGASRVEFTSRTNWTYRLERTADFASWAASSMAVTGTGGTLILTDTNPPAPALFYRVRAERP
jgi:hypothetical protein